MKKKSVVKILSMLVLILLASNIVFATEVNDNVIQPRDLEGEEAVLDGTLPDENTEDGIMPISNPAPEGWSNAENGIEYVEDDVYLCAQDIVYDKLVDGNVYAIGKNITISSLTIVGNLFVCGENVTINADVSGSIYACGNIVEINSGANDIYIAGNKVVFGENSYSYRDIRVASETCEFSGYSYRNFYSTSNKTNINNAAMGGVAGKTYYSGEFNVQNNDNMGEIIEIKVPVKQESESDTFSNVISILAKAFTAIVIILVWANITKNKENVEKENYIIDVLVGLGLIILVPIVAVVLVITLVGLPIGFLIIALYIIALCISIPVAALKISRIILKLTKKSCSNVMKFVLALVVYLVIELIRFIPVVGGVIRFIIMAYGFKVILGTIFSKKENIVKQEQEVIS